jgi:hypothetical protein
LPNTTIVAGKAKHVEGKYHVVLKHQKSGSGVIGGNGTVGGNGVIGGGAAKWLIVEQTATEKP